MQKKILFISEVLSAPFDEGIKNVAFSLYKHLSIKKNTLIVTNAKNRTDNLAIMRIMLNKLFLSKELRKAIINFAPEIIIYLPEASTTFYSFLRAKIIKLLSKKAMVVMLGTQHRNYSGIQAGLIATVLKPDLLLLLSQLDVDFFMNKGIRVKVLPPAVDTERFSPATEEEREQIRFKYNIPNDKKVVLHVGHIKKNRNIECLTTIQNIEEMQVVIVGSTAIVIESDIKRALIDAGVCVISDYIPDISEIYKMADIYIFPVISGSEAIDMPLSVLEAMACNLPVLTTKFGVLTEYFDEDESFRYIDSTENIAGDIKKMSLGKINNRKKVLQFSWGKFTDTVIALSEEIL